MSAAEPRLADGTRVAQLQAQVRRLEQHLAAIATIAAAQFDSASYLAEVPGAALQGFAQQIESLANGALASPLIAAKVESADGGAR